MSNKKLPKIFKFIEDYLYEIHMGYLVVVIVLAGFLYISSSKVAWNTVEEQTLQRQLVVAGSGSVSLRNFIESLERSSLDMAYHLNLGMDEDETKDLLIMNMKNWIGTPVSSVGVLDKDGIEVAVVDRNINVFTGTDYSDRLHFKWAKTAKQGQFFLSKPIVSRHGIAKGKLIVVLSTPLFKDGEFNGLVGIGFVVSELTDSYINFLRLGPETRIYLIDNSGLQLHAPLETLVNVNYFEELSKFNYLGKENAVALMRMALEDKKGGVMKVYLPDMYSGKPSRYLVSYSPIFFNDDKVWTLLIASPEEVVKESLGPLYKNDDRVFTILLMVVLISALLRVTSNKIKTSRSYMQGYEDGKKRKSVG